jgi:peptidoglycan/LPS O-acetylase OafA/YrhL
MAVTTKRHVAAEERRRGTALIVLSGVQAVAALFFMQPPSPAGAIVGVVLGCAIGVLAGLRSVSHPERLIQRRPLKEIAVWGPVYVIVWFTVVGTSKFRRIPDPPSWALIVGEFFTRGAWLTFILSVFTTGICMLLHSLGRAAQPTSHDRS